MTTPASARMLRVCKSIPDVIGSTLGVPRMPSVPKSLGGLVVPLSPIGFSFLPQDPEDDRARLLLDQLDVGGQVDRRRHLVRPRLPAGRVDIDRALLQLK